MIPVPTIDAMDTFLRQTAQFGNLYLSDDQEAAILDGVRSAGAGVLGTSSSAVAVVAGASEGLGQVTSLLEPEHGTVLLVGSDFPSVTYPWLAVAERHGVSLRFVDDRADRDLTQDLVDAIDPTTVVVAFSVVQYATGTRVDARGWRSGRTRWAPASWWTRRSSPVRGSSTPSGGVRTRWSRAGTSGCRPMEAWRCWRSLRIWSSAFPASSAGWVLGARSTSIR